MGRHHRVRTDLPARQDATKESTTLRPGEYLTVSLPRIAPRDIRGIRIVDRAPGLPAPRFASEDGVTWRIVGLVEPEGPVPADSDRAAIEAGFIAVVPMRLDEVDLERLARWRRGTSNFPAGAAAERGR